MKLTGVVGAIVCHVYVRSSTYLDACIYVYYVYYV